MKVTCHCKKAALITFLRACYYWKTTKISLYPVCFDYAFLYCCYVFAVPSCTICTVLCFPKAASLHLNPMTAKIKKRAVGVFRAAWQRCVTFREKERAREEERKRIGGEARGMDSCSEADCMGWLSYQGSSHASKSQIKHPHLAFQPATLLQVHAPSLFYLV